MLLNPFQLFQATFTTAKMLLLKVSQALKGLIFCLSLRLLKREWIFQWWLSSRRSWLVALGWLVNSCHQAFTWGWKVASVRPAGDDLGLLLCAVNQSQRRNRSQNSASCSCAWRWFEQVCGGAWEGAAALRPPAELHPHMAAFVRAVLLSQSRREKSGHFKRGHFCSSGKGSHFFNHGFLFPVCHSCSLSLSVLVLLKWHC